MNTITPSPQIKLEQPLPPQEFHSRIYDELHRAVDDLQAYRLLNLIAEGNLNKDQLRQWAIHRWFLVKEVQKSHGYVYQNCPIESVRKEIIKNIIIEEGPPGPTHPELYVEFCNKAFGVTREELEALRPLPTTVAGRSHLFWSTMTRSWLEGLATTVIGAEKADDPAAPMHKRGNVLHDRYGIPWDALRFFTVHAELEAGDKKEEHGEIGAQVLVEYATSAEMQEKVLAAIWDGVIALQVVDEGIYNHILGH